MTKTDKVKSDAVTKEPGEKSELKLMQERVDKLMRIQLPEIETALPSFMSGQAQTFVRIALTTIKRSPLLMQCGSQSLVGAVMDAAQCGLVVDGILGQGYLVPFKVKGQYQAQFMPGYKGLIKLAYQSDAVSLVEPRMVHDGDEFSFEYGLTPRLRHIPAQSDRRGALTHVYAIVRMKDGGAMFHVMDVQQVNVVRNQSQAWKFQGAKSPWGTHYEAMALKTVIRQTLKYVPQSAANMPLQRAIGIDEANEVDAREPEYSVKPPVERAADFFDAPAAPELDATPAEQEDETPESESGGTVPLSNAFEGWDAKEEH